MNTQTNPTIDQLLTKLEAEHTAKLLLLSSEHQAKVDRIIAVDKRRTELLAELETIDAEYNSIISPVTENIEAIVTTEDIEELPSLETILEEIEILPEPEVNESYEDFIKYINSPLPKKPKKNNRPSEATARTGECIEATVEILEELCRMEPDFTVRPHFATLPNGNWLNIKQVLRLLFSDKQYYRANVGKFAVKENFKYTNQATVTLRTA